MRAEQPGIFLRVPADRAATMAALVAANTCIDVHGRQYALEPLVAVGRVAREIPASGPVAA
eukprot:10050265-Lingulodinium_polyedra.AAC.1